MMPAVLCFYIYTQFATSKSQFPLATLCSLYFTCPTCAAQNFLPHEVRNRVAKPAEYPRSIKQPSDVLTLNDKPTSYHCPGPPIYSRRVAGRDACLYGATTCFWESSRWGRANGLFLRQSWDSRIQGPRRVCHIETEHTGHQEATSRQSDFVVGVSVGKESFLGGTYQLFI